MYDENECTAIVCHAVPTMALVLRITIPGNPEGYVDEIPYCDEHVGWFYRSFSRKSYDTTEVLGLKILLDVDTEFGLNNDS